MNAKQPYCPKCNSEYPYQDGQLWICPECAHEWSAMAGDEPENSAEENAKEQVICDANGNQLNDGDSVMIIKDLKVKGASSSVKVGMKVKNIRLIFDSADGHNIDCKISGIGAMVLKSEFVKKI